MKPGDQAELIMKKTLCKGMKLDQNTYSCKILRYDSAQECIYLVLEESLLKEISLDAIYECTVIDAQMQQTISTGRVIERYNESDGALLKYKVKNGFYKINVKSVDK